MGSDIQNEKRRFGRFVTQLKAHYFLEENRGSLKECTINDISPIGAGIELHEDINVGSTIHLIVSVPGESTPIMIKGALVWIKHKQPKFVGGIELTEMLDNTTFAKLG